jgi:signal transduction histidine kinase
VIQLAAHGVAGSGVELRKETPTPLPPVEGDPEMLKQLLLNLVINAIQAMPEGGEVVVSAALREGKMLISVRDQGAGIAPESRDRILIRSSLPRRVARVSDSPWRTRLRSSTGES